MDVKISIRIAREMQNPAKLNVKAVSGGNAKTGLKAIHIFL